MVWSVWGFMRSIVVLSFMLDEGLVWGMVRGGWRFGSRRGEGGEDLMILHVSDDISCCSAVLLVLAGYSTTKGTQLFVVSVALAV